MNYTWSEGPIEILFIDSAKTWDLVNAVLKGFGPHLVPGKSRIVLQDFHFPWAHCLPLIFDSRPDVWKQVEEVERSHTVTFMLLKPLYGASGISADYSEESFPMESAETLLRGRMARVEPANQYRVLQTLYRKCLIDGPPEEAARLRQEVIAGGVNPADLAVVEDVDSIVLPRGWKAYERGDFHLAKAAAQRCLSIPGKRSIYSLTLLGFSLLRLGLWEQAEVAMNEVLSSEPTFASAKLFRSELAMVRGQYDEAEAEALEVLKSGGVDEMTIQWSLNLVSQARHLRGTGASSGSALSDLADR
jgi:hypothetical protein